MEPAIAAKAANQDWNKNSRSLAYTIANNLFVTTADGKTHQVTDEPKGIVCGQVYTVRNSVFIKVHSGVRKETCSLFTAWMKQW